MAESEFAKHVGLQAPFVTQDAPWGYRVRAGKSPAVSVMVGQAISFFFGVCLLVATLGVLVVPSLLFDGGAAVLRLGAAVIMGGFGVYLVWFASRGAVPDIYVDTKAREIREVVVNRSGKSSTIGVYTFEEISGIDMQLDPQTGQAQLVLSQTQDAHPIRVAIGSEAQLLPLRDRLVQDLLEPAGLSAQ